ncbi:MAG: PAS domain-containing protein, partial [Deltaproteobacteria bacterium]|nr:PAS domain-containing protein [Deltaproteobacteria bacterium]
MVFAAGKHLSEIFNKDTYSEIEKFIGDKSISIKYLSGYIYNRFKSYVLVNIILQKFSINGKQYEHIEIFDTKFLKLLTTYVPHHGPDILNNMEDAIIFLDTNQNIRWTNTAGLKLLKNNLIENLTGRKCYEVFWNKDEFCEDCIVKETIRTGKPEETKKQLPDGRYVSIKSEPVKDDEGKLTGVIKIIRDITDQKEAEIRKKETEERLSLIAEQLPTLIWTVDENLKITYVSGTILKLINIPAENLLGKTLYEIFNTDDPEYPVIKNALYALTGESGNYQIRLMGRNYIVYYKPFINNEGKITGCVGVSQDITELINIQTELQERNEILALLGKINKIISKSGTESQLVDRLLSLFVESPHIRNAIYLFKDNDKDSILLRNSAKKDSLIENISEIRISGEDTSLNPVILCYLDMDIKKISNADTEDINKSLKSAMLR